MSPVLSSWLEVLVVDACVSADPTVSSAIEPVLVLPGRSEVVVEAPPPAEPLAASMMLGPQLVEPHGTTST